VNSSPPGNPILAAEGNGSACCNHFSVILKWPMAESHPFPQETVKYRFLLILAYILLGGYLGNRIYLEVIIQSSRAMDRIVIVSAKARLDIGSLSPGESTIAYFNPRVEGNVNIHTWTCDCHTSLILNEPYGDLEKA